jgi:hypothetical protein
MTLKEIERRLVALETEVAMLMKAGAAPADDSGRWWEQIAGSFARDRAHKEAIRLGRRYRRRKNHRK